MAVDLMSAPKRWTRTGASGPADLLDGRWRVCRPPLRTTGYGVLDTKTSEWVMSGWSSPPVRKVWRRMADAKAAIEIQVDAGRRP